MTHDSYMLCFALIGIQHQNTTGTSTPRAPAQHAHQHTTSTSTARTAINNHADCAAGGHVRMRPSRREDGIHVVAPTLHEHLPRLDGLERIQINVGAEDGVSTPHHPRAFLQAATMRDGMVDHPAAYVCTRGGWSGRWSETEVQKRNAMR